MADVTQLLEAAAAGDRQAVRDLLPQVYDELRKLAAARLAGEKPGQTLQATALVHEAYLRLVPLEAAGADAKPRDFANRRHFFAAAAESMRRILIDQARKKKSVKHGGGRVRLDLADIEPAAAPGDQDIEKLGAALAALAEKDPQAAELVDLRWFAGLSMPQAADMLGLSLRSAERQWAYARAWLFERMESME